MSAIFYHVVMLLIDAAALGVLFLHRRVVTCALVLALAALPAGAIALGKGADFGGAQLAAAGLFVHGPIMLLGSALLMWKPSRATSIACTAAAVLIGAIGIDAFLIEPTWLQISRFEIISAKITRPVKIVVIADLQTDAIGDYERRALKAAMDERPDLILFAGDYLQQRDPPRRAKLRHELNRYLREIKLDAPLGVIAIRGNCDDGMWPEIFESLPVVVARRTQRIECGDIDVTALGTGDSFNPELQLAPSDRFHIVLGHSPNYALGRVDADLLLAGHTHGGQVQLPLVGPVVTASRVPRRWASGKTDIGGGRTLIVSRGVGHERGAAPRLRFFCRPELVVVELKPK